MKNGTLLFLMIIFFYSAYSQEIPLDTVFKAYLNDTLSMRYNMKYTIGSEPDSIISPKVRGEMSIVIEPNSYLYKENNIEYVFINGHSLKVNHQKKKVEILNKENSKSQFDINEMKSFFKKIGVKIFLVSKDKNVLKYYFKFPNADSTACIMSQDAKTGYIKDYKYNVWSQYYDGSFYLKSYFIQYSQYRRQTTNSINQNDYIELNAENKIVAVGKCAGYQILNWDRYKKEQNKN